MDTSLIEKVLLLKYLRSILLSNGQTIYWNGDLIVLIENITYKKNYYGITEKLLCILIIIISQLFDIITVINYQNDISYLSYCFFHTVTKLHMDLQATCLSLQIHWTYNVNSIKSAFCFI